MKVWNAFGGYAAIYGARPTRRQVARVRRLLLAEAQVEGEQEQKRRQRQAQDERFKAMGIS